MCARVLSFRGWLPELALSFPAVRLLLSARASKPGSGTDNDALGPGVRLSAHVLEIEPHYSEKLLVLLPGLARVRDALLATFRATLDLETVSASVTGGAEARLGGSSVRLRGDIGFVSPPLGRVFGGLVRRYVLGERLGEIAVLLRDFFQAVAADEDSFRRAAASSFCMR